MELAAWLRALNLGQYQTVFEQNSVTADLLANLTSEDLKDLGISAVGHRRRLLDAIAALRSDTKVPAIANKDVQSSVDHYQQASSTAERRHISVMFCDLVDFTRLSARLD